MLHARNRMTRSSDFDAAVKSGRKVVQPDMVIYVRPASGDPRVGLIVSRSVGSAVERHGLSRRLRHTARDVLTDLSLSGHIVVRALPSCRGVSSAVLGEQLRTGLRRAAASRSTQ